MAKAKFNPLIEQLTGKMGGMVFRRAHTGQQSLIKAPDMSRVKWSQAQKDHRVRFRQATHYAKQAIADPDIRPIYERMAAEKKKNNRPYDMAVSDYFKGNDLLLKKLLDSQKKSS